MPIETALLAHTPPPLSVCPKCQTQPFRPFLRGQVQRTPFIAPFAFLGSLLRHQPFAYCAVICSACKYIVDYEVP